MRWLQRSELAKALAHDRAQPFCAEPRVHQGVIVLELTVAGVTATLRSLNRERASSSAKTGVRTRCSPSPVRYESSQRYRCRRSSDST